MPAASRDQQVPRQEVFISYSRKDKEFVRQLDEALKSRGREPWVDWEGIPPGDKWEKTIYGAIEATNTFIFVLTPDSIASKVCGKEIAHAAANNKRLVPIVHRQVPDEEVPKSLGELNFIFCRDNDNFVEATDKLISALDTDLDWVRAHTRLLTRAIEWDANGRNNSFVLRGEDLRSAERWLAEAGGQKERQPTALQKEYISASRKASTRRQRITVGAVGFGAVVAIVLAMVSCYQRNIAEDRRRVAQARQLESQARVALDSSAEGVQRSALFAVESLKSAWTVDGYIACARAISLLPLPPNIRPAHKTKVLALAYSADGRWLASEDADARLVIWDTIAKKQIIPEIKRQGSMVFAGLAFSPDGKWLVSTRGGDAVLWETATWQITKELRHGGTVWSVAFSPGGDLLATASPAEVKLYSTSTWEEIAPSDELAEKQKRGGSEHAAAFSPNGQWLAMAADSLTIWDITAGRTLNRTENLKARSLAFSPDSQSLIAGGELSGLQRIALAEGANAEPFAEHAGRIRGVVFSRDGRYLASAGVDETVRIWDVETKRELLRVPQKTSAVAFAPDGRFIVTGNSDGTLGEWPISRGTAAKVLQYDSAVKAVAFSPDGRFLVIGSADGSMRIHNAEAGDWSQIATKNVGAEILSVGFSPDGRWLAAIAGNSAHLYSIPGWVEAFPQFGFGEDSVHAVSFSPDGKWIALQTRRPAPGGAHGYLMTTRVFELATRQAVGWISHADVLNVPETSGGDLKLVDNAASWTVMRLGAQSAKSSDGRWITVPGEGLTLADAQLQRPAEIVQHDGNVTDAAFSPNGRWLATASEDHSVRIWPLRAEDLIPLARLHLQRNLSYDEWRQAFEEQPYSKTCPDLPIHPSFLEAGRMLAEKGDIKGATAIFRRAIELQPDPKLDPKAEAQRLAEGAKRANAAKITEQERR